MCADINLIVWGLDCVDAYAHACSPSDTYLAVDEAYAEWYENKYKKRLNSRHVLPVQHALQGHPESGKMWMKLIDRNLIREFGFSTTTHDRCIYRRIVDGSVQIILRQVDDFLIGCADEKTAKTLGNNIGLKIWFPPEEEAGIVHM